VPSIDQQAFKPAVAVAADGTVAVSYYDFRNNTPAPGALTDYWMAFCHPSTTAPATNPASWSEVRLTDTSFNLEQAPSRTFFRTNFFLGDYEGLAAAGNDFVAVWGMPNGTGANQESIFFRRVISTTHAPPSGAMAPASAVPESGLVAGAGGAAAARFLTSSPNGVALLHAMDVAQLPSSSGTAGWAWQDRPDGSPAPHLGPLPVTTGRGSAHDVQVPPERSQSALNRRLRHALSADLGDSLTDLLSSEDPGPGWTA
jgi:hypothetical protein